MKKVLMLLFVILLSTFVSARFLETVSPVRDDIFTGEKASFLVNITNKDSIGQEYTISTIDLNWKLVRSYENIYVAGKANRIIQIELTPRYENLSLGGYAILIKITSGEDKMQEVLKITLVKPDEVLKSKIIAPDSIDPNKETSLSLQITNMYNILFEDAEVKLSGDLFRVDQKITILPFDTKTIDFKAEFPENTKEGDYLATILVKSGDLKLMDGEIIIPIGSYSNQKEVVEHKVGMLIYRDVLVKINNGNTLLEETYTKELSCFKKLFTSFEPEPTRVEERDENKAYIWEISLEPGETKTITIKTDYLTPLIVLVVLIVLSWGIYKWKKRSISVKRKVLVSKNREGITSAKVIITLKNTSRKDIANLKMVERLPASLKRPINISGQPTKIKQEDSGTSIIWEIGRMTGGEERIISYDAETKYPIKIVLTPTAVKYIDNNQFYIAKSKTNVLN